MKLRPRDAGRAHSAQAASPTVKVRASRPARDRVLDALTDVPLRRRALLLESMAWEARQEFNDKEHARVCG